MIPTLEYLDHIGLTVPDLEEAKQFFIECFGAEFLYDGQRQSDHSLMRRTFDVPGDAAFKLAMLRLPPNLNLELFQWTVADQRTQMPRLCDMDAHHLCFSVNAIESALEVLAKHPGVRILGSINTVPEGAVGAGVKWVYLRTGWGLHLELVDRSGATGALPNYVRPLTKTIA